jgi:tRNA U55 pseudouridine synthase TruB
LNTLTQSASQIDEAHALQAQACLDESQMKFTSKVSSSKKNKKTQIKIKRRPVHGVLLIDKPLGASSNQVLQRVKWLLKAEKAGHTGTLDPLASGVLPICLGAATKFSQLHLDSDKTYLAIARLGENTSGAC